MNHEKSFVVAIEDLVEQDETEHCCVDDHVVVSAHVTVEASVMSEPA